jgi:hypothetical protein
MTITRRLFLATGCVTLTTWSLAASAQAKVDEKDPQAVALGYVPQASQADVKKFPRYAAGQMCSSCALYQGKPGEAAGGCALFAGKQVNATAWCSAWVKKTA